MYAGETVVLFAELLSPDRLSVNCESDGFAFPTRGKCKHEPSKHKLLKIPGPGFAAILFVYDFNDIANFVGAPRVSLVCEYCDATEPTVDVAPFIDITPIEPDRLESPACTIEPLGFIFEIIFKSVEDVTSEEL